MVNELRVVGRCCFSSSTMFDAILLFTLFFSASEAASTVNASLTAGERYDLLSGDFELQFHIPLEVNLSARGGGYVELVSVENGSRIAGLGVPPFGVPFGVLTIDCGKLHVAATVKGRLLDRNTGKTVLAETSPIQVVWPSDPALMTLSLPETFEALTDDITLQLTVNDDVRMCESSRQGAYYSLELAYLGPNESYDPTVGDGFSIRQPIDTQKFTTLMSIRSLVNYPCRRVDQAGIYRAYLVSSGDPSHPVAVSNPVEVTWSSAYSLSAVGNVTSVLPCVGQFEVQHARPSCAGDNDKIQLYGVKSRHVVDVDPADLVYVTERRVVGGSPSTVSFGCREFKPNVTAYCFKYLSTAENGAVHDQRRLCLPTVAYPEPGWSTWSSWSNCVAPSGDCDETGRRSRHRTCDNPAPVNEYAPFCPGLPVEWTDCKATTACNRHPDRNAQTTTPSSFTAKPSCLCGCTMTELNGHVVAPSRDTRKTCDQSGMIVWLIMVPVGHFIRLQVIRGPSVSPVPRGTSSSVVTIRDGDTPFSNLLLALPKPYDALADDSRPSSGVVTSTGNHLRVECRFAESSSPDDTLDFVAAYYTVIAARDESANRDVLIDDVSIPFSHTSSFIVVVIVCPLVVVLVGAIAACLHLRLVQRRRLLLDKLDQSTPAHEALLPSGAGPSGLGQDSSEQHHSSSKRSNRHHKTPEATSGTDGKLSSMGGKSDRQTKAADHRVSTTCSSGDIRHSSDGASAAGGAPVARCDDFEDLDDDDDNEKRSRRKRTKRRSSPELSGETSERIRLERYDYRTRSCRKVDEDDEEETICMLEKRPPVEGASLTRDHVESIDDNPAPSSKMMTTARYVPPTRSTIAAVRDLRRPDLDVARLPRLPLLEDGAKVESVSDELSPLTSSRPLFGDEYDGEDDEGRPISPALSDTMIPDDVEEVDLEYDDYVPELPGSYFTMDPHAYTLTWSKQAAAPWDVTEVDPTQTAGETSVSNKDGGRSTSGQYYF